MLRLILTLAAILMFTPIAAAASFDCDKAQTAFEKAVFTDPTLSHQDEVLAKAYATEGTKLPSETHEARYFDRLVQAYPIHPEVFDRLYEDWTTLESFQRTRGVLKLMARVIFRLWKDQNQDLMILPGSLPLRRSARPAKAPSSRR